MIKQMGKMLKVYLDVECKTFFVLFLFRNLILGRKIDFVKGKWARYYDAEFDPLIFFHDKFYPKISMSIYLLPSASCMRAGRCLSLHLLFTAGLHPHYHPHAAPGFSDSSFYCFPLSHLMCCWNPHCTVNHLPIFTPLNFCPCLMAKSWPL